MVLPLVRIQNLFRLILRLLNLFLRPCNGSPWLWRYFRIFNDRYLSLIHLSKKHAMPHIYFSFIIKKWSFICILTQTQLSTQHRRLFANIDIGTAVDLFFLHYFILSIFTLFFILFMNKIRKDRKKGETQASTSNNYNSFTLYIFWNINLYHDKRWYHISINVVSVYI